MDRPKLTASELRIMGVIWERGASSIREIQEGLAPRDRLAYTTVQTMVYRLEAKRAVRRLKKIGNAHVFEAAIGRPAAERRVIDDLLAIFGGRAQPVVSHLVESGRLSLEDLRQAEKTLRRLGHKEQK